jgi:putative ABC transport system permease protein
MRAIRAFLSRLNGNLQRQRIERELAEELESHLAMQIADNLRAGMSPEQARREALLKSGGLETSKESCRDRRGLPLIEAALRDFAHTMRQVRRSPGFTAVVVLTLALGIGANAAIFSIVDAVFLRRLPFPEPQRLVNLNCDLAGTNMPDIGMSIPELEDFRDRSGVFRELSAAWPMDGNLTGGNKPERIEALAVSASYFRMLGTKPSLGRLFLPEDGVPWISPTTVISYGIWKRLFGSDPNILGRRVYLDYDLFVVAGVLPPEFRHPGAVLQSEPDFYITGSFRGGSFPLNPGRGERYIPSAIGRLAPGVTLRQAQSKLEGFAHALSAQYPRDYPAAAKWTPRITSLQASLAAGSRSILLVTMGAVMLVLLTCCAMIANLLLARASVRRKEFSLRAALGASRLDIIGQLAVESFTLSFLGALAGVFLAVEAIPILVEFAPISLPHVNGFAIHGDVVGFTLLTTVATAVLCGMAPALHLSRSNLTSDLKNKGQGAGTGRTVHRARAVLVVSQIALSFILMTGAGLLGRSLWNMLRVNAGFNPSHVLSGSIWFPPPDGHEERTRKYDSLDKRSLFVEQLLGRLRTIPGVESAAVGSADAIPLTGWNSHGFALEGNNAQQDQSFSAQVSSITPDYLQVVGSRLSYGRGFTDADRGGYRVALINEALARRFWKSERPLGKRIRTWGNWWVIVGVVGDIRTTGLDQPPLPHIYVPIYQASDYAMSILLRTSTPPGAQMRALERGVRTVDPDLSVFAIRTMDQVVSRSMGTRRFALLTMGGFGIVSLGLALMGVYAVMAFAVEQRTQEIGIRIALGAGRGRVLGVILRQGMWLTVWGLLSGTLGAIWLTRFLQGFLFGATPTDARTFACVAAMLTALAFLSCYFPARRAASLDPTTALRAE